MPSRPSRTPTRTPPASTRMWCAAPRSQASSSLRRAIVEEALGAQEPGGCLRGRPRGHARAHGRGLESRSGVHVRSARRSPRTSASRPRAGGASARERRQRRALVGLDHDRPRGRGWRASLAVVGGGLTREVRELLLDAAKLEGERRRACGAASEDALDGVEGSSARTSDERDDAVVNRDDRFGPTSVNA